MWPVFLILVFVIALAARPMRGDGWFWELGNGLGFLAFALLVVLVFHGRGGQGPSARHRWLGLSTLLLTLAHCLWFLIGDPISWEYLKWGAPHYMVAGLLSFALMVLVSVSSLASLRSASYVSHTPFRNWHRWLSVGVLFAALLHVILSGFYIVTWWQPLLLVGISLLAFYLPVWCKLDVSFLRRSIVLISALALTTYYGLRVGLAS